MNKIIINGIELSEEQSKPILDNPTVSMIIAGAGSGKTFTIIGKIKYMLDNNLVRPYEICAITYTNKAVESLKNKIKDITSDRVDVFTFHKLSLELLNRANISYSVASSDFLDVIIENFFQSKAFGNEKLLDIIYRYFHVYFFKTDKNYKKILNSKKYQMFKRVIKAFINYMNSNNLKDKFDSLLHNKKHQKEMLIIYAIYVIYSQELNSSDLIDFDKMIEKATFILKNNKIDLPYKLVIIDEFQDTSLLRLNLVKELVNKTGASLMVVGDDYQAIYRFQGCDISLFLNFKKHFSNAKVYYLNETYRNSQNLIDIAGNFIKKNPYQVNKNLTSKKSLCKPVKIVFYNNESTILTDIINKISYDKQILIIGRNNFDVKKYISNYELEDSVLKIHNDKHVLRYLTIHSSKGLESDVVIIINVVDDTYGIPSQIKEERVLKLLKPVEEYPYAEERRLFYVALTRTKGEVYLLTTRSNPSIFIKELIKNKDIEIINM